MKSIWQTIEAVVQQDPLRIAVVSGTNQLTYTDLLDMSQRVTAFLLQQEGFQPGQMIPVALGRSEIFPAIVMGIWRAGGAYIPLNPDHPVSRTNAILKMAGASVILGDQPIPGLPDRLTVWMVEEVMKTTETGPVKEYHFPEEDQPAYVLFTSGSTGHPKGVIISHRALSNHLKAIATYWPYQEPVSGSCLSPFVFDVSLWEIFSVLGTGGIIHIFPEEYSYDLDLLIRGFSDGQITQAYIPPGLIPEMAERFSDKPVMLPLQRILVGVEPIKPDHLAVIYRSCREVVVLNGYGPTESTVCCTVYPFQPGQGPEERVPIGWPMPGYRIRLVDPEGREVDPGVSGEIWVGGESLSDGYLNDPELTARYFIEDQDGSRWFKTGDKAYQLEEGVLMFAGRIDLQLKIRGFKVEPAEIETKMEEFKGVKEAAVIDLVNDKGYRYLKGFVGVSADTPFDKGQLTGFLAEQLPDYMVPAIIEVLETLPRTANGKIDREVLRSMKLVRESANEPVTSLESEILECWKEVLEKEDIQVDDSFFTYGGNSITAAQIAAGIEARTGKRCRTGLLLKYPTVHLLAEHLEGVAQVTREASVDLDQQAGARFSLLPTQEELIYLHESDRGGITHNILTRFDITVEEEPEKVQSALQQFIESQPSLYIRFTRESGHWEQEPIPDYRCEIPFRTVVNLDEEEREEAIQQAVRHIKRISFSPDEGPMQAGTLLQTHPNTYVWIWSVHHLVFDGWSMSIMLRDLKSLLHGAEINKKADYRGWIEENLILYRQTTESEISERIAQLIPYSLPFDISYSRGRTANVITDGGRQWFTISNEVYDRLGALAQSNNATLYQLMYTLFGMLLSFYSGKSRFLISTPFANRYTPLADQVTGYGITILPLGYEIHGDLSFSDHLRRIIPVIREGFNQTYFSPGQIIKPLNERYPDLQTTLMQAMFILQNWEHHEDPDDPVQIIQTDIGNATAKMLVTLNGERVKEGLECWMEYPTRFMDDDLMVQMVADYQKLIDLVLEEPDMQIRSLRNRWVPDHPVWAVHPSAAFIGETSLVLACMKYWVESGGLVSAVMTKDRETQKWAESQGIYIIPFGKKHLPEFHSLVIDYLFSVVNSYILDEETLAVPRVGAINYHDAPLPAYAGVHATSWAIMEGQSTHGITWHYMVPETDEGPVIIQKPVKIEPQMKVSDLDAKCYELAIEAFKELTQSALHGKLKPIRVPGQKSYYGLHKKPEQGGIIDFSRPGSEIVNLYRALSFSKYYPNYFCSLKLAFPDQVLYPQQVEWLQRKSGEEPGTLLSVTDSAIQVACSDGIIYLSQFEDRFRNPVPLANLLPYLSSMTGKKVFSAPGNETVQWLESLSKKERKWVRYWSGKEELPAAPVPGVAGEQLIDEVKIPDMNDTEVAISLLVFMKLVDPDWTFGIEVVTGKAPEWIRWFTEPVLPVDIGKFDPEDFVALYESLKQQIEDATPENAFVSDLWYRHPELIRPGWNGPVYHWTVRFVPPDTPLREGDLAIHHGVIRLARGEDRERQMKITNWSKRFIRLVNYFHPQKFGDEIPKDILLLEREKAFIPPEITWSYKAIGEWFLETARTYPEKTALKFQERALTFQEVYQTVRRVANFIYRPAVREARIAVCLERSPESVMAQLAIYLLGYTYIPIDPNNPETRIRYILQKSKPAVLLTDAALYREIQPYADIPVKLWDEMLTGKELYDFPEVSEKQIAYMLFTSGSTGEPKGVPIPYAALSRFIQDSIYRYNLTHQDTGLQFASLAFDASMEEIFPILLSGGTLVIRTEAWLGSVSGFLEQVNKHGITFLDLPTAYWQVVIRDIYKKKTGLPETVRQVIIGGDYAQPSVFAMWQELFPEHPRLVNTYGPTEATVVCVAWDKTLAPENKEALPIGLPVNSLQARVVMENGLDAPPGIAGELWMGGPTLSPGYFENPDLTQKKWVHYHDIRWYRTGDWVWRNPDGVMYFQGRVDDQIKVGGFLVDLNEVLRVLSQLEGVREAAVRAVTMHDNQKMIIGYVLFPSGAPDESFIKERMARSLPAYMIPHRILAVDEIPYNQNNKVDWRKLPVPDPSSDAAGSSEKVTLTDPLEQKIQTLFQEHLGVSYMDPDADIFEMGMSSLTAVAVLSELESHWGQPIPLAILLQYPTVRSLAAGLKESNEKEFFRPLVKIKTGGSKRPLFIIHGAGLNVLLFNTLKDLLDPGQPIYGIQAKGMDGESPILSKLEDIIDSYMSEIKSVQSIGPYALAGFSIGGLIAFELARQMQDQGDDVDFIGVFDTYAESSIQRWPKLKRMMYKMRWSWNRFWYNLFLVLKEPRDVLPKKLKWLKFKIKSRLTGGEPVRGEELEDLPDKLFHIANITIRAVLSLELKPFDGPVHVFRAAHRNFYIPDRVYLGWKPYAKGGVIIHEIPGDHSHIFAAPNDKEFAKVLQQALNDSYEEFMRKMNSDVKE